MNNPLCDSLIEAVNTGLTPIQQAFDVYQKECFVAHPPEFFCLELCGEAGELANLEKKRWKGAPPNDAHTADEAADVLIALMNFCNARGVNLAEAVSSKLARIQPTSIKPSFPAG